MASIHAYLIVHEPECDTVDVRTCCCSPQPLVVHAEFTPVPGDLRRSILRARGAAREAARAWIREHG